MLRIFILSFLLSTKLFAFTLGSSTNTALKGFSSKTIYFLVNDSSCPSSKNVKAATAKAISAWNQATSSNINLVYGGASSSSGYSSKPIISCDTSFSTTTSLDADYVGGAGSFQSSNNRIVTGAILLNAESGKNANIQNWSDDALVALIAHEMGHVLGLGHSSDTTALMYYSVSRTSLYISQDDIDGITYLYPRDELDGDSMLGCGSVVASSIIGSGPRGSSGAGPTLSKIAASKGAKNKWPLILLMALPLLLALLLRLKSESTIPSEPTKKGS